MKLIPLLYGSREETVLDIVYGINDGYVGQGMVVMSFSGLVFQVVGDGLKTVLKLRSTYSKNMSNKFSHGYSQYRVNVFRPSQQP